MSVERIQTIGTSEKECRMGHTEDTERNVDASEVASQARLRIRRLQLQWSLCVTYDAAHIEPHSREHCLQQ